MSRPFRLIVLAVLACLAAAAPAAAAPASSELSSRLQALSGADLRSASPAKQAKEVSLLAHGPGSLLRDGDSLIVNVRVAGNARARLAGLKRAGATIVAVASDYDLVSVSVPEGKLRALAAAPGVESVTEELTPMTGGVEGDSAAGRINTCATGVVSEGDSQLGAAAARSQFDIDGTGVKVGVMSDSFNTGTMPIKQANDIASGDLPGPGNPCGRTTPVQILDDSAGVQGDEGRAMTQIVHDLAPGAGLAFATAFTGQVAFANNIQALANAGAKVIVDDIIYFNEPYYQDGIVANAVNNVTSQGVAYFSMAFNNNRVIAGNDSNSWEAPAYRGGATCPALVGGSDCMDFNPGPGVDSSFNLTATGGRDFRIGLQWAEPQNGVSTDLDLYVINTAANTIPAQSIDSNPTTGIPSEFVSFTPGNTAAGNYQIVIKRFSGTGTPRLKWVNNDNGSGSIAALEYPVSSGGDVIGPAIYGHNGTAGAQTVGAVPFSNSSVMEDFSGRGPVTHLFGPVNGVSPAPALNPPQVLSKPDVAATDGGITTFFGSGNRFFGTSAAAPHAAAVGALQLDAEPALTQSELKAAQKSTAVPVGSFGPLAAGAGLIDAPAAIVAGDKTPPALSILKGPKKKTKSKVAKFKFDVEPGATISCTLDKKAKPCGPNPTFRVKAGKHKLTIEATDLAGNQRSVSYSWKVKRRRRSTERRRRSGVALGIDVVDRRQRGVGGAAGGRGDVLAAAGEPVEDRDGPDDLEPLLAAPLDRLDGGAAGRDDVLDDQDTGSGVEQRALDPALEAVLLLLLADEEGEQVVAGRIGDGGARDRVGAHRHSSDGGGAQPRSLGGDELAERAEPRLAQDRALGVDVVGGGGAAGQRHLTDHECVLAQLRDQRLPRAHRLTVIRRRRLDPRYRSSCRCGPSRGSGCADTRGLPDRPGRRGSRASRSRG